MSLSRHTLKQLKFILPGGLITYYLGSHVAFWRLVKGQAGADSWARYVLIIINGFAAPCSLLIVLLEFSRSQRWGQQSSRSPSSCIFYPSRLYKGDNLTCVTVIQRSLSIPHGRLQYQHWRQSGVLSSVIPVRVLVNYFRAEYTHT